MPETVITSVISFIGTNIDDIFILMLFFAQADTRQKISSVIAGQYLGVGILVLLSFLGARGLQFLPQAYIGLLGLIPIGLGIKELLDHQQKKRSDGDRNDESSNGRNNDSNAESYDDSNDSSIAAAAKGPVFRVMLVTVANGADNIGVYLPLFAGYTMAQMAVAVITFALLVALWCFFCKKLSDLPFLRGFLSKYRHIIVPVVFIGLGIYILASGG